MERTQHRSAFSAKTRDIDELVNLDATDYHIVPYVTGGLGRLVRLIKEDKVPNLPNYGHFTNKDGEFTPQNSCLMGLRYDVKKIIDSKGQSAVLILAEDLFQSNCPVVIKVLHTQFYKLGAQESHVLWRLAMTDPLNYSQTLRILTTFTFDSHYCMVFEPLLPDPLTSIFQEFPQHRVLSNIKKVGLRLLATIGFLHQQNLIHTDLKPDNILLKYENDLDSVHVVDFGNTINYIHSEVSLYYKDFELQTPLYRAPEVMFGVPFGPEIDIWSLGCIFAELFLGKPLVIGDTREDILKQMYDLLGPFPAKLFRRGMFYKNLKQYTSIEDQVNASTTIIEHLQSKDYMFADLLAGMLRYNPDERLTASQAAQHPFFASHFPVGFLLPAGVSGIQLSVPISKQAYQYSPEIAPDIKKGQPSSIDLLRIGTSEQHSIRISEYNRIGTSEQHSELEESTILKPSPRYKLKGENLSMFDEPTQLFPSNISTIGTTLTNRKHKETGYSDMSVVKNVITERKDKFSDNVKEKMSSLLKAINQEQNLVEDDMEKRQENSKRLSSAVQTDRKSSDSTVSIRPVPTYGTYRGESMASSKLLSSSYSFREPVKCEETELVKRANKTNVIDSKERNFLERLCQYDGSPSKAKASETCRLSGKKAESSERTFTIKKNISSSMPMGNQEKNSPDLKRKTTNKISQRNNEYKVFDKQKSCEAFTSQRFTASTTVNSPSVNNGANVDNKLGSTHIISSSETKSYKNNWKKSPESDKVAYYDVTATSFDEVSDIKSKKSTAKVRSDLILSEGRTSVTKGSLSSSMEGRKRVHADISDDEVIDILSPISNLSTRKRQKQMINSPGRKQLDLFREVRQISGPRSISSPRNGGKLVQGEFGNGCQPKSSDDAHDVRNSGYCVRDVDEDTTFSKPALTDVDYTQSSPRGTVKKKHFEFMSENWNLQNSNNYQKHSTYKSEKNVQRESKTNLTGERKCTSKVFENKKSNIELEETDEQGIDNLMNDKTKQRCMQFHDKNQQRHQDPGKHVKSKPVKKAFGEMPTPIPKFPNAIIDNNEFIVDSPEVIYRKFKQQSQGIKQKTVTHTQRYNKAHKNFHNRLSDGHKRYLSVEKNDTGVSKEILDKKAQIYFKEGSSYRRKSGSSTNTQVEQVKSNLHIDSKHVQLKQKHDQFSFLGTPASDVKTKGEFAQRIADRRKKLKKKARKSLNFQESEEYSGESSEGLDSLEADYIDSTYREEILNHAAEADYPALLQDRVKIPKPGDGHNTVLLQSHQELGHGQKLRNTGKESGEESGDNSPHFYRTDTGHKMLTYRHDKTERRSGSNLIQSYTRDDIRRTSSDLSGSSAGYSNLKQRDTGRMMKIPRCDATFVMDFESPLRHGQGKP